MKPIYRFILHVINNWDNGLNEAYAPAIKKQLFDKFRKQADNLVTKRAISDEKINKYIERFDQLRNSSDILEKDLFQYTFGELEALVTKSPGTETPELADITPDVVYHNDDNTVVIYNGSKEGNCITNLSHEFLVTKLFSLTS